jgi:CDP-paratose 2-epimerase
MYPGRAGCFFENIVYHYSIVNAMHILITGGAGFIGSNLASFYGKKHAVTVFDSLERKGSEKNAAWLKKTIPAIRIIKGEITDADILRKVTQNVDVVFHLAAQVAVTNSVADPKKDFQVNMVGTFTLLEAIRKSGQKPSIIYTSTNKVYGDIERTKGWKKHPIAETQPLDFYSPYACSKGGADCYIHDYSRIYGIPTTVFRQSCIYGTRQYGTEDQGWVAHFVRRALDGKPITIYGDGKQMRDLLFIDDLIRMFDMTLKHRKITSGQIYNVGGGEDNAVTLNTVIKKIEKLLKQKIIVTYADERPGDQHYFVSDCAKAQKQLGWHPTIAVDEGLSKLISWMKKS